MPDRPEMSEALQLLETSISRFLGDALPSPETWVDHGAMERVLVSVRKVFDSPVSTVNRNRVADAVAAFRQTGRISNVIELRYICLGVGDIRNGWCVLCDPELREILRVRSEEGNHRQRLKSFQSLLRSYLSFARDDEETPASAHQGWVALRGWLFTQFASLSKEFLQDQKARRPDWFRILGDHLNLLTASPCDIYGQGLLQGDTKALQEARTGLAIPQDSWVLDEAVLAQAKYVVGLDDSSFRGALLKTLEVVDGRSELKISKQLAIRCIALLVSRYARCTSRPEHIRLRDAALESVGNPWLRRQAWDAFVLDQARRPDDEAREMILGWLRQRLIKDFFELLSDDRAAEPRRLNYWLRFEPAIEDMWFVLGSQARRSSEPDYVDFRKRARGRLLGLSGQTNPANNAFVMRIGNYVAIEFGLNGNACFICELDKLPKMIAKKLASGADHLEVDIESLRRGIKLVHRDSPRAKESWEEKFDQTIIPTVGHRPGQSPFSLRRVRATSSRDPVTPGRGQQDVVFHRKPTDESPAAPAVAQLFSWVDVERHAAKHKLRVEDNRRKGGAYWVLAGNWDPKITKELRDWGFRFKPEKGWWKE